MCERVGVQLQGERAGLGSEPMRSAGMQLELGAKTSYPSVGAQDWGGGCSWVPATGQKGEGGVYSFLLGDSPVGSWAERFLGLKQPLH